MFGASNGRLVNIMEWRIGCAVVLTVLNGPAENECRPATPKAVYTHSTEGRTDAANDMISIPIRAPAKESLAREGLWRDTAELVLLLMQ